MKLLQKFQQSNVIREVRGKQPQLTADSNCRFSFVTEPGPFNFIEETTSPLGKRDRSSTCTTRGVRSKENHRGSGAFFANSHALIPGGRERLGEEGKGVGPRKTARLALVDVNSGTIKPSPSQVAKIWKELTLARSVCLSKKIMWGCFALYPVTTSVYVCIYMYMYVSSTYVSLCYNSLYYTCTCTYRALKYSLRCMWCNYPTANTVYGHTDLQHTPTV